MKNSPLFSLIFLCLFNSCNDVKTVADLSTDNFMLRINNSGEFAAFEDNLSNTNYLALDTIAPVMAIRIDNNYYAPQKASYTNNELILTYLDSISASISIEEKETHINFELTSLSHKDDIELITWGPYPTTINKVIGETVGVVRGESFAIGIQSLNIKTLGGYPWNESDRMPAMDIFKQEDINNMHPDSDGSVLYRVEAARPTLWGSSIQAYSRNRDEARIISDFNHEKIEVPPYQDGGVIGSKIALFGVPVDQALATLGKIEVEEGLPHPIIDGEWGKIAPEAASAYLITNFTEDNIQEAIDLTKMAGLKYMYHYGKTFENWGQFDLFKGEFPSGVDGLRACVEKAEAQGVKVGTHFLSNFITTNDPYVTPIPDERLAKVGSSQITSDIGIDDTEIPIASPDYFNQMKNNHLKTVHIGDELIRYGTVSSQAPWTLLDCQRGAHGTNATSHNSGESISKLLDHGYKVFLTETDLTIEMSETMADLYNNTGLRQISFDGLEGNRSTGLGTYGETLMPYTWYNNLTDDLKSHLIIDASRTTHFFWHIYSRMNWGEPWYAGFRESQTEYRFNNQAYFKRNFMPGMLGWFKMAPETTIEDIEWMLARSAGYDAGYALVLNMETVEENGNSEKMLQLIGDWEKLRIGGKFSEDQKERLRNNDLEFSLSKISDSEWELHQISGGIFNHEKRDKQPGEPLHSIFNFNNEGSEQVMNFILTARNSDVSNIIIELNNYKKIKLPVTLMKDQILKYSGGSKAMVYSPTWQVIKEIELNPSDFKLSTGDQTVLLDCQFNNAEDKALLKFEIRALDKGEKVSL